MSVSSIKSPVTPNRNSPIQRNTDSDNKKNKNKGSKDVYRSPLSIAFNPPMLSNTEFNSDFSD